MANPRAVRPSDSGLQCRKCGGCASAVLYTRRRFGCVIRSRKCKHCGQRMVTRERPIGES